MSGNAIKLERAIAGLQRQYGLTPPPFVPVPLREAADHDIMLAGYASPATVDREFMRFSPNCWQPFKPDIPVLFRHNSTQPAGTLEQIKIDDNGLFVRCLVRHEQAKRCPYFSICATIHDWRLVTGARPHAEITSATLDEVSLIPASPGNATERPPGRVLRSRQARLQGDDKNGRDHRGGEWQVAPERPLR